MKNGKYGILYLTNAPKLDVLKPTPKPKIKVKRMLKRKKGSA